MAKRLKKLRLWADERSWLVQQWVTNKAGVGAWTPIRHYGSIEGLARAEMQYRARDRVSAGMDVTAALRLAGTDTAKALKDLLEEVVAKKVPIPALEMSRMGRKVKS